MKRKHNLLWKQGPQVSGRDRGGKGRPLQVMVLVVQEELGARGSRDFLILSWALGWLRLEN